MPVPVSQWGQDLQLRLVVYLPTGRAYACATQDAKGESGVEGQALPEDAGNKALVRRDQDSSHDGAWVPSAYRCEGATVMGVEQAINDLRSALYVARQDLHVVEKKLRPGYGHDRALWLDCPAMVCKRDRKVYRETGSLVPKERNKYAYRAYQRNLQKLIDRMRKYATPEEVELRD